MSYPRPEAAQMAQAMFTRWQDGETLREIGEDYGLTKAAVQSRIARAGLYIPRGRRSYRDVVATKMAMPRVERDPCVRCGQNPEHGRCAHMLGGIV